MSKYDFSKERAEAYLWAHENMEPISDEMFSKACAWIQPSPLAPQQMKELMDLLNEDILVPLGRPTDRMSSRDNGPIDSDNQVIGPSLGVVWLSHWRSFAGFLRNPQDFTLLM